MNGKDPAKIVAKMSGGFLVIENAGAMNQETVDKLNPGYGIPDGLHGADYRG